MTFRNECGKVNELLMSNEITKEFEKSFEKCEKVVDKEMKM